MRRYRLLLLGVVTYLLFLLMLFPAATAWSWFAPKGVPLQLQGISGSIWQGKAAQSLWNRQPLGSLSWDLQLLPLFLGSLGVDFSLQTAQGVLEGDADIGLGSGVIQLSDFTGQLPVSELMRFVPPMPIPVAVNGTVTLDIQQLELNPASNTVHATGRINWHSAEVLSPQAFKMGNLQADISTDEKGVLAAQLKDLGGPLQLDALFTLNADRSYALSGSVAAAREAEASLTQALGWLGKVDGSGKHRLNLNGKL